MPNEKLKSPEDWVELHGDYLYRFALSRIKDPAIAEDLVQETFLAALQSRKNFKGLSSERTWLTAILKHKLADTYRRQSKEKPLNDWELDTDAIDARFDQDGAWKIRPKKWPDDPVKAYEQQEFMDILYRCLADLPRRLADAFIMREIEELSTDEICKVLDITATNTWVMLYRARMYLRGCLEKNWIDQTV